jgi:hypothetical protein
VLVKRFSRRVLNGVLEQRLLPLVLRLQLTLHSDASDRFHLGRVHSGIHQP